MGYRIYFIMGGVKHTTQHNQSIMVILMMRAFCIQLFGRSISGWWSLSQWMYVWPWVEGGCPLTWYQPQGKFTHPQCLQRHTPSRLRTSASPWVDVTWWVSVRKRIWDSNLVACWCSAWHVTLWHLGSISTTCLSCPFRFLKSANRRSQCNYLWTTPILTQAKLGEALRQW